MHQHNARWHHWLAYTRPWQSFQSADIFYCSGLHAARLYKDPKKTPRLPDNQTMAAPSSTCCRLLHRLNSSSFLRRRVQWVSGKIQRLCSSVTHRENKLELGDSTFSAPNFASSLKARSRQVSGRLQCVALTFTVTVYTHASCWSYLLTWHIDWRYFSWRAVLVFLG